MGVLPYFVEIGFVGSVGHANDWREGQP